MSFTFTTGAGAKLASSRVNSRHTTYTSSGRGSDKTHVLANVSIQTVHYEHNEEPFFLLCVILEKSK